jgi:hypothetical protein
MQVGACISGSRCFHPVGVGQCRELVLEKPESWCSQQVGACKTEVVASL